jgi:all-trans-nonaprenyl-diphosphate synthase
MVKKMVEESMRQICPRVETARVEFKRAEEGVAHLYDYIRKEILNEDDSELDGEFLDKAHYLFQKSGKKIRPILVTLLAYHTQGGPSDLLSSLTQKWSALVEIMHIASLAHDDIIDDSPSRRGQISQHLKYGAKVAVFSGNYIISKASRELHGLGSERLYEIYAHAMDSLAEGEVIQLLSKSKNKFTVDGEEKRAGFPLMLERYLHKTYYKTAALMSSSLCAVPTLHRLAHTSPSPVEREEECFRVGQHLGLAFQLVDDILDYISTEAEMGKEEMTDLIQGNVTAPVYFTYYHYQGQNKGLMEVLNQKYKNKEQAMEVKGWVHEGVGIELTYLLAAKHIQAAL